MLKFAYVLFLAITSFLLFIFSKEKHIMPCKNEISGSISLITDSAGSYLAIVTTNNTILRPYSMNEDIVLAAGQKVKICYNIDSAQIIPGKNTLPVHIEAITYQP
ncbi:MAG: hypothetical protein KF862_17515 [Chitinophagaceae bacterium]|nr:hypothetical protein [Chitinophagaceae bacterium]